MRPDTGTLRHETVQVHDSNDVAASVAAMTTTNGACVDDDNHPLLDGYPQGYQATAAAAAAAADAAAPSTSAPDTRWPASTSANTPYWCAVDHHNRSGISTIMHEDLFMHGSQARDPQTDHSSSLTNERGKAVLP